MRIIDATDAVLGRFASEIAKLLLNGEQVAVINAEKALVTGRRNSIMRKYDQKKKLSHARKGPHYSRMPDKILWRTVRGMLPYQKPRGRKALRKLRVYISTPNELAKRKAEKVAGKRASGYVTLAQISQRLGK